jgi:PEP-CTERM motif
MTARTRCANRISESPQPAVSPMEPPAAKFEEPFDGTAAPLPFPGDFVALGPSREFSGLGAAAPPGLMSSGGSAPFPGGGLPPIFPPPIPSKSCLAADIKEAATSLGKGNPCPHHKPPPPSVPEPATLFLVGSGIAGIYWRRRAQRH